ncbi:MAG: phosphoribosylglycinamide formyltransferase [Candidatus Aegiribacteria sp.]|nr:phosphoribosylglycinamide formyltransferase [Candidatus Aegiribacteria sp.]
MIHSGSDNRNDIRKIAVLASGRGSNFEALCRGDTGHGRVTLLISDNSEAPALNRASDLDVEALYMYPGNYRTRFGLDEEKQWADLMLDRGIGLVCLAGLMRILKGPVLETFAGRIMNIHPSLLPSFPGLNSQRQALDYGVRVSGCTVHYVDSGTDTGPVILQRTVPVLDDDTEDSLAARILKQEHIAYSEAVKLHCSGVLSHDGRRILRKEN